MPSRGAVAPRVAHIAETNTEVARGAPSLVAGFGAGRSRCALMFQGGHMSLETTSARRRVAQRLAHRARSIVTKATPVMCEGLKSRFLMAIHTWDISWIGPTPTSAELRPGDLVGQVEVWLNTNTGSLPDHTFGEENRDSSGSL